MNKKSVICLNCSSNFSIINNPKRYDILCPYCKNFIAIEDLYVPKFKDFDKR